MMAPIVAWLVQNGLGLLAGAVKAKGQDFIEEKLGVKLDDHMGTEEGRIKLAQIEADNEDSLREFAIRKAELELQADAQDHANTDSARQMNATIQDSAQASTLAKNLAYLLDIAIVSGTIALILLLYFKAIPAENKDIAYMALGSLLTMCGTVVNFHRGSSAGSKGKDDTNAKLMAAIGSRK